MMIGQGNDEPTFETPIKAGLAASSLPQSPESITASDSAQVRGTTDHSDLSSPQAIVQNRAVVFATLFLVTGVLGIPLLWMNKSFSTLERIVWSIVVTVYTAVLIYGAYLICLWSYHRIFG